MERFLGIDWKPPLEDLLDEVFIHEDRLQQDSAMHKIMRGNFVDPFEDIENDYDEVNLDLIHEFDNAKGKEKCNTNTTVTVTDTKCDDEGKNKQANPKVPIVKETNVRAYVPGIVKPSITFPRSSHLSKKQHSACLNVLLTFSSSQKPEMTQSNREDLETYYELKETITKEQDEYLELAKSNWDGSKLKIICEDYINKRWKCKMERLNKLHRYYNEILSIPLKGNQKVNVTFLQTCLRGGSLPTIVLPTLKKPYMMYMKPKELETKYPVSCSQLTESLVSEDPLCEKLAIANDVDLVVSSSGLYTLLNNVGPNYSNSWILPVTVKTHDNKKSVYIDKPVPPTLCTVPEKNTWVYKYILKCYLLGARNGSTKNCTSVENVPEDESLFGNVNSDKFLKLEENTEHDSQSILNSQEDIGADHGSDHCSDHRSDHGSETVNNISEGRNGSLKASEVNNVSYNLFTITPQPSEQSEFMKNNLTKQYKILVRSKTDGVEKFSNEKDMQLLMIAPKLEHQVGLGAEAITQAEGLRQWAMLTFRPGASLARVRISAQTSEVLQIERRTAISVSRELRRLYNLNAEDTPTTLYNIIQELTSIAPGHYVLRHTVRNGAFAIVYAQVDTPDKNTFDLHNISGTSQFCTIPIAPWPMLDKTVTTPMLKCFERMPCMYYPPKNMKTSGKRKFTKNIGSKDAAELRRSQRNKSES